MSKSKTNSHTTDLFGLFQLLPEKQKKEISSFFLKHLDKLKTIYPQLNEGELLHSFLKALVKKQFKYFVMFFVSLIDAQELDFSFHVEVLCEVCQQHSKNNLLFDNDVVINIPPGHSKTLICNVLYSAWLLGNEPSLRIIVKTLSEKVATETNQKVGVIMTSFAFKDVFGDIVVSALNEEIKTIKDGIVGYRRSQPFFAGVLSQNADVIICDDPNSTTANGYVDSADFKAVINTYKTGIATRQRGTDNSLQNLIIQQRVGVFDLSGDILRVAEESERPVNHICIRAFEEKDFDFIIKCKNGNIKFKREKGYLWLPKSEKMLKNRLNLYETMRRDHYLWSSQYQQDPSDTSLSIISLDNFNWYEEDIEDLQISSMFITCDIAFAGITTLDKTCCCCWGMTNEGTIYLLDIIFGKIATEILPDTIKDFYKKNSLRYFKIKGQKHEVPVFCGKFYIEDTHNEVLLPYLKQHIKNVETLKRAGTTKQSRITEALPAISQKIVYLPKKRYFNEINLIKEELRQLTPELLGKVPDDFADNLTDCINYGRAGAVRMQKIIEFFKKNVN